MAEGLLVANGEGMSPLPRNFRKIQRPRQFDGAGLREIQSTAIACRMHAAQIPPRPIGEMDRMGAAQQFQERTQPYGLVIRMRHHKRDWRIHKTARFQIPHDGLGAS
jgi:hypothetical protein